jgi:hypothetical protein
MAGRQKGSTTLNFIKDPILEPYFIQIDDYNYALCKMNTTEGNKGYETKIGFYSDLGNCLNAMVRNQIAQQSFKSLQDYITQYKELQNRLINHFNL